MTPKRKYSKVSSDDQRSLLFPDFVSQYRITVLKLLRIL